MIDWLRDDHQNPSVELADGALPIAIRRHAQAKRLTMRLAADGSELRITVPRWGSTKDALAFAKSRVDWIETQLARIPQQVEIGPGALLPFRGIELLIDWQASAKRKPQLVDDRLILGGPEDTIAARIRRWLEAQALEQFAIDLALYCQRAEQELPQLRLSRAKKRWGSCSGPRPSKQKKSLLIRSTPQKERCIRINWRLIMSPDHVRRSVVAHEVAHLTHFDHSPAFHALLGQLYGDDLDQADGWLKTDGRKLYSLLG